MSNDRPPDAELEVLACLWRRGEATAREIRETMAPYRPLAHASVVTLLTRLEGKGLVRRRKAETGKAFVYSATKAPTSTQRRVVGDLVERIFGGDGNALVASLVESQEMDAGQIEHLQELLDGLKRKKRKKRSKRKKGG